MQTLRQPWQILALSVALALAACAGPPPGRETASPVPPTRLAQIAGVVVEPPATQPAVVATRTLPQTHMVTQVPALPAPGQAATIVPPASTLAPAPPELPTAAPTATPPPPTATGAVTPAPAGPTAEQQQILAGLRVIGPAPELFNETWLNSEPLKLADLRGKVVLIEFWTFG